MNASTATGRLRPHAKSFLDSLRQLLTPAIWKQATKARRCRRACPRWATQPLVLTLLILTWSCGDSQAERFETAKAFTACCLSKRRRPGQTLQGFHDALVRLPRLVLRVLAAGVRRRLLALLRLADGPFVIFGCDGSALECPRTAELQQRLDAPAKRGGPPQLWVTALVHLRTGLLWAWRLGKGKNRERSHLRALLPALPAAALVVADAGYNGYELARALVAAGVSFLIRMSAKDRLYTEGPWAPRGFRDGAVLLWPLEARRQGLPPLRVRLLRLRGPKAGKDVWLLTDVLDSKRLSAAQAGQYYRWRWENEGLFRTYKRTLGKVKLRGRTVAQVHREAEGALLATQLLLGQGTLARPRSGRVGVPVRCSPRKVLLAIREVILGRIGVKQGERFAARLAEAMRKERPRQSAKEKRRWPRRVGHKPPKPPQIRELTAREKVLLDKLVKLAA
jgi:DDE family transposase